MERMWTEGKEKVERIYRGTGKKSVEGTHRKSMSFCVSDDVEGNSSRADQLKNYCFYIAKIRFTGTFC